MARAFTEADYQRAIAYPWERPAGSFVFRGGEAQELEDGAAVPELGSPRHALLAIGSNASPRALRRKFAELGGRDAEALVITGELTDYTIAPSAHLAIYGSLPATLARETGSAARAALMLVTDAQLDALGITEFNYHVVQLAASEFVPDHELPSFADPMAYLSCHGVFAPEGRHLAHLTQAEALDVAAALVLGEGADGRQLVKRTIEDYRWALGTAIPTLEQYALAVDTDEWHVISEALALSHQAP